MASSGGGRRHRPCQGRVSPAGSSAVAARIAFVSNGVMPGCLARMSAAIPAMCGAAKLLPVALIRLAGIDQRDLKDLRRRRPKAQSLPKTHEASGAQG